MNLRQPKSKDWQEVARTHPAFASHLERYPYLGMLPQAGGHYYIFYDQGVQGILMVMKDDLEKGWKIGCSFSPDYRGVRAKKACQNWLERYKITYKPLLAQCLAENKPAQYLAAQLGFKRDLPKNGWVNYHLAF